MAYDIKKIESIIYSIYFDNFENYIWVMLTLLIFGAIELLPFKNGISKGHIWRHHIRFWSIFTSVRYSFTFLNLNPVFTIAVMVLSYQWGLDRYTFKFSAKLNTNIFIETVNMAMAIFRQIGPFWKNSSV